MKKASAQELSFRVPMLVTQARLFRPDGVYPVCPQCSVTMDREYQNYCGFCGQHLDWKAYKKAEIVCRED
ncbi:hypothetical protein D1646_19540 [Pseudoflavonifractor sp. 60]|uniref:hypothetical protein n=1 Tax=Pseudoflavonifractor sp. 60 TaxID=2304576 RepID=UPI00136C1295|nr:hypothetical protein [Pseudoflavonifractor sp. 60]NBI68937.1 hypothetical protein [Pseudoflavonifractor sp. 60]